MIVHDLLPVVLRVIGKHEHAYRSEVLLHRTIELVDTDRAYFAVHFPTRFRMLFEDPVCYGVFRDERDHIGADHVPSPQSVYPVAVISCAFCSS